MICFQDEHLRMPVKHRKAIRTNILERLFGEERQRLKVVPRQSLSQHYPVQHEVHFLSAMPIRAILNDGGSESRTDY